MDPKAIGRRIKQAREKRKLTQEQLAELVFLSPMHVSVIERGVKLPKLETLINIANVLKVTTDELLQDVLEKTTLVANHELSELLDSLSPYDQERILCSLRTFVEMSK